jgi:hypothetical protein
MAPKNSDPRCKARAKSGKRCRAAATAGGLCFFHANPRKASELGRIGGRSKRHAAESADALPNLDNALAVRDTLARLIADLYSGKLHPRVAAGLAPLLNLQLRAIEATNFERRLTKIEKLLAAAGVEGVLDSDNEAPSSISATSRSAKPEGDFGGNGVQSEERTESRSEPCCSVNPRTDETIEVYSLPDD